MSIINDALKRAERSSCLSQHKPRRWLIWTALTLVCFLGVILAMSSFKSPADKSLVDKSPVLPIQQAIPDIGIPASVFDLKEIDIEITRGSSDFCLSGILYDEQKPMAIINQRIVGKGALVNGAELLEIQPSYVRLSLEGKEFTLKVK